VVRAQDLDTTLKEGDYLRTGLGGLVERFDHVSMAVRDIDSSNHFTLLMGGNRFDGGINDPGRFRWVQYRLAGGSVLEMIAPLDTEDPDHFINRFIAERGEGLHHVTLKVSDLHKAVAAAEALGFEVVGIDESDPAWKEAFVHPKSANGVLVQLAEFPDGVH
jgi:methylmalonyl-CoA/ethylmalonyl-CoA epimerase